MFGSRRWCQDPWHQLEALSHGLLWRCNQAFTLHALTGQLARAAHSFGLLTRALFRRLFEMHVTLHFAEGTFALHLLLQRLQRLVDIIVAHENLNDD